MFRFYLYELEYYSEYGISLFDALKNRDERTDDPDRANIFITCFSDERHYPKYGDLSPYIDSSLGPAREAITNLPYFDRGRHLVFYHTEPPFQHDNLINIPYCKENFDEARDFIICPPALSQSAFNGSEKKKYLLSFKGNMGDKADRALRFNVLGNIKSQNIRDCLISSRREQVDYQELIKSSVFSLVVDGDCHWSYRLTEVINMGSIPVIITDGNWTNIPFSNMVDYHLFSLLIRKEKVSILKELLENISDRQIALLTENLRYVNENYFKDRAVQLDAMLRFMSAVYHDLPSRQT